MRSSPPPLTWSRCLRRVFISWIDAPQASRALVRRCRSSRETPGTGWASRADPPPEIRQNTRSFSPRSRSRSVMARVAPRLRSSGTGWPPTWTWTAGWMVLGLRGQGLGDDCAGRQLFGDEGSQAARHRGAGLARAHQDDPPGRLQVDPLAGDLQPAPGPAHGLFTAASGSTASIAACRMRVTGLELGNLWSEAGIERNSWLMSSILTRETRPGNSLRRLRLG